MVANQVERRRQIPDDGIKCYRMDIHGNVNPTLDHDIIVAVTIYAIRPHGSDKVPTHNSEGIGDNHEMEILCFVYDRAKSHRISRIHLWA